MKKALKITGAVFLGLILLLALVPFLFKDKIKEKLDSEIAKSINAKVYYDADQFSLTIFRNFPNLTLSLGDFGMVGKAEAFAGDTLMNVDQFKIVLDIMSVVKGDKIKINSVYLKQPYILTKYTKEGAFSWDITYPDTAAVDTAAASAEPSKFALNVAKWEIEDGTIIYDDPTMPVYARLNHLDHTGKGDITEAIYDISTYTKSPEVLVTFDGVTYLNKVLVEVDAAMNINMTESKYTFKENVFTINNFKFGFDGVVAMPDTNISVDIKYAAKETDFKSLISLVPSVFMEGYEKLTADGKVAFDGYAKGIYNAVSMPAFGLNLKVDNAMMKYPDLPSALTNINMDLKVESKDGVIDHTIIDLKKFHLDMGSNPINAEAYVNGMNPYDIQKCNVNASVKLEEVTKMFPMDSLTLKGLFTLGVSAKGKYSDTQMPNVQANAALTNGYVKYDGFAEALEDVNMKASVNSDGNMKTSSAILEFLRLKLDKEPFELAAKVINFDDPNYDAVFKGNIDLAKMTKLFPIEGTTLSGVIVADVKTKGIMSDVTEGRYGNTSTSGTMDITNLKYVSAADLPQGFGLSSANFVFSPEKIDITKMIGNAGKSDINVTGYFSNYMGYLFGGKDTTIHGKMTFKSKKFNVNEWMTEDSTAAPAATPAQEELTVLEIPKNIDFVLTSTLDKVLYDNMTMTNMVGDIIMKDGVISMKGINFGILEGTVGMNGTYAAKNSKKALFDFDMDVKNIGIKDAFKTFNTVQKLAPMAENMDGKFSTILKLNGTLGKDMMPIYEQLNGQGSMLLASATIKDNKALKQLGTLTKSNMDPLTLQDVKIKYKIENGNLIVDPFDINAGNIKMNISGSNSLAGALNYKIKADIPAGAAGAAINGALSNLTGKPVSGNQNIKVNFKVGGTVDKPVITPEGGGGDNSVADAKKELQDKAKAELDKAKADAEAKAKAELDKAKADAEAKAKAEADKAKAKAKKEADKAKADAEAKAKAEADRLKKEAEQKAKDELKKKLKF